MVDAPIHQPAVAFQRACPTNHNHEMDREFSIGNSKLTGRGFGSSFLRRTITDFENGLLLVPGTGVQKLVDVFEKHCGLAGKQLAPFNSSIQLEDVTKVLDTQNGTNCRSIMETCLYLSRQRPDLMFVITEPAGKMSTPALASFQHVREMLHQAENVGNFTLNLD